MESAHILFACFWPAGQFQRALVIQEEAREDNYILKIGTQEFFVTNWPKACAV